MHVPRYRAKPSYRPLAHRACGRTPRPPRFLLSTPPRRKSHSAPTSPRGDGMPDRPPEEAEGDRRVDAGGRSCEKERDAPVSAAHPARSDLREQFRASVVRLDPPATFPEPRYAPVRTVVPRCRSPPEPVSREPLQNRSAQRPAPLPYRFALQMRRSFRFPQSLPCRSGPSTGRSKLQMPA